MQINAGSYRVISDERRSDNNSVYRFVQVIDRLSFLFRMDFADAEAAAFY